MDINPEPVDTEGELRSMEGEMGSMGKSCLWREGGGQCKGDKGEGIKP